jgi:CO/xanthine dehydrogenase FAD-binding subunit
VIGREGSERVVPIASFYTGPGETVLEPNELVLRVRIPKAAVARRAAFEKLGLWQGDFAVASAAVAAAIDGDGRWRDVRVVLGALAPTPWRAERTEAALEGKAVTPDALRRALDSELDWVGHPLERNAWKLDAAAGLAAKAALRLSPGL